MSSIRKFNYVLHFFHKHAEKLQSIWNVTWKQKPKCVEICIYFVRIVVNFLLNCDGNNWKKMSLILFESICCLHANSWQITHEQNRSKIDNWIELIWILSKNSVIYVTVLQAQYKSHMRSMCEFGKINEISNLNQFSLNLIAIESLMAYKVFLSLWYVAYSQRFFMVHWFIECIALTEYWFTRTLTIINILPVQSPSIYICINPECRIMNRWVSSISRYILQNSEFRLILNMSNFIVDCINFIDSVKMNNLFRDSLKLTDIQHSIQLMHVLNQHIPLLLYREKNLTNPIL